MGKNNAISVEIGQQTIFAYCSKNGLDAKRIDFFSKEWSYKTGNVIAAFVKSNVVPHGLTNDMETLPNVVLYCDGSGTVYETEHTHLLKANS